MRVPFLSPRLSSYWIGWVTRADVALARELVEGLSEDLLCTDPPFWPLLERAPKAFDVAAREALEAEAGALPLRARALERVLQKVLPWKRADTSP